MVVPPLAAPGAHHPDTIHPDDPKAIYLSVEHGGVIRSLDQGASWENVSVGIDYLDIHMVQNLPHSFDRYYVASARGFFTSTDPVKGWQRAENGMTRDYFHNFVFLPPSREEDKPTMLIASANQSPGFWRREGRGGQLGYLPEPGLRGVVASGDPRTPRSGTAYGLGTGKTPP
jgi:hypothetical protein